MGVWSFSKCSSLNSAHLRGVFFLTWIYIHCMCALHHYRKRILKKKNNFSKRRFNHLIIFCKYKNQNLKTGSLALDLHEKKLKTCQWTISLSSCECSKPGTRVDVQYVEYVLYGRKPTTWENCSFRSLLTRTQPVIGGHIYRDEYSHLINKPIISSCAGLRSSLLLHGKLLPFFPITSHFFLRC